MGNLVLKWLLHDLADLNAGGSNPLSSGPILSILAGLEGFELRFYRGGEELRLPLEPLVVMTLRWQPVEA